MRFQKILLLLLILIGLAVSALPARAAGTAELELVGDARGSAMAFQEWARALGKAGIRNVRIRAAEEPGQPKIDIQGTAESPIYIVTGIVLSRDELQLPGVRFRRSEAGRLAQWLDDLAAHGPADKREKKGAFGLSAAEMEHVRKDLATPVGFRTQGIARQDVVRKIADRLKLPLRLEAGDDHRNHASHGAAAVPALGDNKVEDQLSGLSCGTALACALRPAGYCLVPRAENGQLGYAAVKSQAGLEVWPVGWEPEKPGREVLPGLYEFRNVNVQNVSAAAALEAIGTALKTPVLVDHVALARHGVEPAKVRVSAPAEPDHLQLGAQEAAVPGEAEVRGAVRRGRHALSLDQHDQAGQVNVLLTLRVRKSLISLPRANCPKSAR